MAYRNYEDAEKRPDGVPIYGVDRELYGKQQAKRGDEGERDAQAWIEAVTGQRFTSSFEEHLKDGLVLCDLVNRISPGAVPRVNRMRQPFMQMENITFYLDACKRLGVDLYEAKNIPQVVTQITSLGRIAQRIATFRGPHLGAKLAEKQTIEFSEKQMNEARNMPIRLDSTATGQSGNVFGASIRHQVVLVSDAPVSSEPTRISGGSPPAAPPKPSGLSPPPPRPAAAAPAPAASSFGGRPPAPLAAAATTTATTATAAVTAGVATLTLDDLERLASMRDRGIITNDEFEAKKRQILGL